MEKEGWNFKALVLQNSLHLLKVALIRAEIKKTIKKKLLEQIKTLKRDIKRL